MNGIHLSVANKISPAGGLARNGWDERADVKVPRFIQANQYVRQYRRAQYRTGQSEHDEGEKNEEGRYEPRPLLVHLLQTVRA